MKDQVLKEFRDNYITTIGTDHRKNSYHRRQALPELRKDITTIGDSLQNR